MPNPYQLGTQLHEAYERGYQAGVNEKRPQPTADFEQFWRAYPRRIGKGAALKAWKSQKPGLSEVLAALKWQCKQDGWTKDGGQFIPHPATWLNAQRWFDEDPQAHKDNFKRLAPRQKPEDDGPLAF